MSHYTQANRPLAITTPLGADALLLEKLSGAEAISELFCFQLDLLAEQPVPFEQVLGQTATLTLAWPDQPKRFISGIVNRFSQDGRVRSADGQVTLLCYQAELVPRFWLLTKRVQSRIFQHLSIPDILKQVLKNEWQLEVKFQLLGTYPARDYCVQYRESDFAFVSRLMEEEGIFYYFVHTADNHTLIVSDSATVHPELPGRSTILYDELAGGQRQETRIRSWKKSQELRACKVNLWDYCFELPTSNFEAQHTIPESVPVGQSTHAMNLQVAANNVEMMQILDYPGGYAKRFDGINKGGAEQPAEIQKIFKENQRTTKIRMEQEAVAGLAVEGASDCAHFVPGHHFQLNGHFFADGRYLLTRVRHEASLEGAYVTGRDEPGDLYTNDFHGIPLALPYRPRQVTPKPTILGTQTAVVVGPKGEEIFTDKYGRVKVQFPWDRHGKKDADSSCWVRVAQPWAGGNFGAIAIPRVGHEVVVGFEDGDPDQPIILGCVYNARQMPPFKLPDNRMASGIKSNAVGGNPAKNFSGLAFNDKAGDEHVSLYAEKNMMFNAENNHEHHVGNYQHAKIGRKSLTVVGGIPGISGGGSGGGGGAPPPPPAGASGTTQEGDTVQGGQITAIGQPPDRGYGNWKTSDGQLAAVPGYSGGTVYGINSQDTTGFMHQITIGQATQIVIDGNPWNSWGYLPSTGGTANFLPSQFMSLGGNQQLYWGTNYQSTYGPNVSYTYAPQLNLTAKPSLKTTVMAKLLPLLCVVYEAGYAACTTDTAAEVALVGFSAIVVAGIGLLAKYQKADQVEKLTADTTAAATEVAAVVPTLGVAGSKLASDLPKTLIKHVAATKQAGINAPLSDADAAHSVTFVDGVMLQVANHIQLIARTDPTLDPTGPPPEPSTIFINSAGNGTDGVAFLNATKGMALTSGGALLELDNKQNTSGDITMQCGPLGTMMMYNLPICGPGAQLIQLDKTSITLNAGALVSLTLDQKSITLVCGPNKITMDPKGVTIDALNITLQAKLKHETKAMLHKKQVTLGDLQITLAKYQ